MSGRAGIGLLTIATALFTASSATADPVNTAPPVLSVTQGSNPVLTVSSGSWTTGTPPSKAAPLDVGSYDVQWQRCSYANAVVDHAPIAYYRLGEASGRTAVDSSGLRFDGAYTGLVTLGMQGALSTNADTSVGFYGRALGATTPTAPTIVAATIESGLPSGSAPITVEAWVKPASSFYPNFEPILSFGDLAVGTWGFGLRPTGSSSASLALDGPGEVAASAATLTPGVWHFVAATDDGSSQRLYIDGVPAGSFSAATTKPSSTSLYLGYEPTPRVVIGGTSRPGGEYFAGTLDEVAVYDSILGASDIAGQYAAATDSQSGAGCEDIPGETGRSYVAGVDDAGAALRAQISTWDDAGLTSATTSTFAVAGKAPVWALGHAQAGGPIIDSGMLTDDSGVPIPGATVTLYPDVGTESTVRPPPLASTTTDANGQYQITLANSGQVPKFENDGVLNLTRLITTPSGISTGSFGRTFIGGMWTDDHADLLTPALISLQPNNPTFIPGHVPPGVVTDPGGCRPITQFVGETDAYAPVGEIHLFADDYGSFTYGQDNFADSTFGVGVSTDGVNFSVGGSTHVGNSAQVGWGTSGTPLQPYFSHVLLTRFHFEKTLTKTCFSRQYRVEATQWETGAQVGQDTSGNDGRCNLYADHAVSFTANTSLIRNRGRAFSYDGAISVLGASLSVKSGYSSNVVLSMTFGTSLPTHWVCGDNDWPSNSARVFAGP